MTPGEYLRKRREAHSVSLRRAIRVVPAMAAIEADQQSPTIADVGKLGILFGFDEVILLDMAAGEPVPVCRVCGCTERDPCEDDDGRTCGWAEYGDLCTTCQPKETKQ